MSGIVKIECIMVGTAVAGFVALAVIGRVLQARGVVVDPAAMGRVMFPVIMGLFMLFGFGLIGLALHCFIVGQAKIGNAELAPISFLRRSEAGIAIGVWAFLGLGFSIAYPFMRQDMLGPSPPRIGPSTGVLRANIGQTMDQVRASSTLKLSPTLDIRLNNSTQTLGQGVFDFEIADSAVRFEKCRYYFITTGPKGAKTIDSMNIGISPYKKPKLQSEADEEDIHRRLTADGWVPGRFVWRTEKELTLSGGKPTSGEGRYWGKSNTLIIISSKRMDDPQPGEDAKTAGEYILTLDIVPRDRSSYTNLDYGSNAGIQPERKPSPAD